MSPDPSNPYTPPAAQVPLPTPDIAQGVAAIREAVRKEHLNTEANIRSIGCLWMLSIPIGLGILATALLPLLGNSAGTEASTPGGGEVVIMGVIALVVLAQGVVGYHLRKLSPAARIPATIFACLGLLAFPIGSIISLFILITLCRPKGCRVLSSDYREVIAATPHIKYRTPVWVWVLLGLFILAIVIPVVLPLLAAILR